MTEKTELDIDIDLQRKEQNIQNLLDDFDFFLEHLEEEAQKWNYVVENNDGTWSVFYHNITEDNERYADERLALEHLFDHIRMVENETDSDLPLLF